MASRKGFTLIEVLMSVTIMSIMLGVMTLNYSVAAQTPKREAEKLAAYLTRLIQKSNRIKVGFQVEIPHATALYVSWDAAGNHTEPPFDISEGLRYAPHFNSADLTATSILKMVYDCKNYPNGASINVVGNIESDTNGTFIEISADKSLPYYVLITKGGL